MEIKEVFDVESFDPSKLYSSAPFTQAFFYGEWQENVGRKVWRFLITEKSATDGASQTIGAFQIIKYSLPFRKSFLYIPYGPVLFCEPTSPLLAEVKIFLKNLSKKENAIFARTDFTIPEKFYIDQKFSSNISDTFAKTFSPTPRHTYHSAQFQPRFEWHIDLSKTTEDLLGDFHKNTRYSVRISEKNNVSTKIIEENLSAHFSEFYAILKETSARDGFSLHKKEYYENIFKQCDKDHSAVLVMSSFNEKVLSANLVILYGDTGMFAFGGTLSENRNVMPAYAAQKATMQFLKEKGYHWYNLGGVTGEKDVHTSWQGLSAFKKRFGGKEVWHANFYDVVAQPFWYFLYNLYKRFK